MSAIKNIVNLNNSKIRTKTHLTLSHLVSSLDPGVVRHQASDTAIQGFGKQSLSKGRDRLSFEIRIFKKLLPLFGKLLRKNYTFPESRTNNNVNIVRIEWLKASHCSRLANVVAFGVLLVIFWNIAVYRFVKIKFWQRAESNR